LAVLYTETGENASGQKRGNDQKTGLPLGLLFWGSHWSVRAGLPHTARQDFALLRDFRSPHLPLKTLWTIFGIGKEYRLRKALNHSQRKFRLRFRRLNQTITKSQCGSCSHHGKNSGDSILFRGSIARRSDFLCTLRSDDYSFPRNTRFQWSVNLTGQACPARYSSKGFQWLDSTSLSPPFTNFLAQGVWIFSCEFGNMGGKWVPTND